MTMSERCRNRVVRAGTGLGKTEGVPVAWVWHRVQRDDPSSPRRLAYLETLLRVADCRASATRGVHSAELQP